MKKNSAFREEVRSKVDELLCSAQSRSRNASLDDIREKIVSMICDPLHVWQDEDESEDDFSAKKERWIAP